MEPQTKTLVFTAGLVLLLQLLSIFLPPFPCLWTESRWDARTAPTLPTPTPQPRAQAQIEAHTWIAAYQISGAALTPAPPRWVGRKAAAAWGARSRNAGEKPTGRPPKNPSRPGPRAFLFSFLLCALTSSLSLSRPGSSNKAGRKMGALASLVSLQAPPPTLEVTAHGVKCSGNAGAATVNCTANPCGL